MAWRGVGPKLNSGCFRVEKESVAATISKKTSVFIGVNRIASTNDKRKAVEDFASMNYEPIRISVSLASYSEFVQESRLETPGDESQWSLDCHCIVDPGSREMIRAHKAHVSVSFSEDDRFEGENQIGRLSQPDVDGVRLLSARIGIRKGEFLRFVDFLRAHGQHSVKIQLGIYSPEIAEEDFLDGIWDYRPFPEIQTFSYWSETEISNSMS